MEKALTLKNRLGYLSAAPRISTRPDAEISGPRSHILGFIQAMEVLGWEVKPFIAGDRVPREWVTKKSEAAISGNFLRALTLDWVRLTLGLINARQAWREMGGQVGWVYERFAPFQTLGWIFKQHGVPWILETHGPLFYEAKTERKTSIMSGLARQIEVRAYRKCDALVCVTEALKDLIVLESGIAPEKVIVVPNGVDTELFNPEQYQPKRMFAGFTVGFVGRLYAWHGLEILIHALHELREAGMDISLVVVGDGIMLAQWKALTEKLGIASNVAFVGQVSWSDVQQYIAGFDMGYTGQVQMQVGKMYHSPLKLYEYMAMAKPVVASAFEDAKRVISQGETGFLFEPGNKEDLKRTLTLAYQSKEQLPAMGKQARELMVAQHSWTARINAMMESLEQVLGRKQ